MIICVQNESRKWGSLFFGCHFWNSSNPIYWFILLQRRLKYRTSVNDLSLTSRIPYPPHSANDLFTYTGKYLCCTGVAPAGFTRFKYHWTKCSDKIVCNLWCVKSDFPLKAWWTLNCTVQLIKHDTIYTVTGALLVFQPFARFKSSLSHLKMVKTIS